MVRLVAGGAGWLLAGLLILGATLPGLPSIPGLDAESVRTVGGGNPYEPLALFLGFLAAVLVVGVLLASGVRPRRRSTTPLIPAGDAVTGISERGAASAVPRTNDGFGRPPIGPDPAQRNGSRKPAVPGVGAHPGLRVGDPLGHQLGLEDPLIASLDAERRRGAPDPAVVVVDPAVAVHGRPAWVRRLDQRIVTSGSREDPAVAETTGRGRGGATAIGRRGS